MPSDQKDRYIRYLIEQQEEKDLELRAMKLAVEEFQSIHDGVAESLANLQKEMAEFQNEMAEIRSELSSERSKRKAAEAKARKLDQQLKYAQKNRFGDKRQKARKDEKKDDAADREDEKDRFDGTDGTVSTQSVQEHPAEGHPTEEKKERDLSKRPEKYGKCPKFGVIANLEVESVVNTFAVIIHLKLSHYGNDRLRKRV